VMAGMPWSPSDVLSLQAPQAALSPGREASDAGRRCALWALRALGIQPAPIGRGAGGEPIWPIGIIGSISHTPGYVCALVARGLGAVGIDVERADRQLSPRAWGWVGGACTLHEGGVREQAAVFALKEAFFKLAYPSVRYRFGFDAVHVAIHGASVGCSLRVERDLSSAFPRGLILHGNYIYFSAFVLAWVCAPPQRGREASGK